MRPNGALLLLIGSLSAQAAEKTGAQPQADFWEYMERYADAQGQILDPSDLEELKKIPSNDNKTSVQAKSQEQIKK